MVCNSETRTQDYNLQGWEMGTGIYGEWCGYNIVITYNIKIISVLGYHLIRVLIVQILQTSRSKCIYCWTSNRL